MKHENQVHSFEYLDKVHLLGELVWTGLLETETEDD